MKETFLDSLLWAITMAFIILVGWHSDRQHAKHNRHKLELLEALLDHLNQQGIVPPVKLIVMLTELRLHVKMDSEKWYDVFRRRKATK